MAHASGLSGRFADRVSDRAVGHDIRVLGDFVGIFCRGAHGDRERRLARTPAASLGVYGRRPPRVCAECEAHLAYGERRRAFCPKEPKPFCAHCDTHCYSQDERAWQRQMMRYSGPRSIMRGHLLDAIRHAIEVRAHRAAARRAASEGAETR